MIPPNVMSMLAEQGYTQSALFGSCVIRASRLYEVTAAAGVVSLEPIGVVGPTWCFPFPQ